MPTVDHLIIGGGMTASAAAMGILSESPRASVAMISAEPHPPYERPPLSKDLWHERVPDLDEITHDRDLFGGAELVLGRRVVRLDPAAHEAVDDAGVTWRYGTALLATGATARRPPFPHRAEHVRTFRTRDDFSALHARMAEVRRVLVLGGGFLGGELASALRSRGAEVTMAFPERDVGALVFPAPLAAALTRHYKRKGVHVLRSTLVDAVTGSDPHHVTTDAGEDFPAAVVVAAVGVVPNDGLARAAGIRTGNGIVVDDRFRTSAPDVFAAGDVALFPAPVLGPMRVEHEDHAKTGGVHAGRAMAGAREPYDHLPYVYGDLFDLGYEAVGRLDPTLDVVLDGGIAEAEPGVAYYLDGGRVRGVLTWGVFGRMEDARELIRADAPVDAAALKGRIPLG